jgi:hypothetical protein
MFMEQPENIVDRYNTLFDYQLMRDRCSDGLVDDNTTDPLALSGINEQAPSRLVARYH